MSFLTGVQNPLQTAAVRPQQPNPYAQQPTGQTPNQERNAQRQESAAQLQAAGRMGQTLNGPFLT